MSTGGSDVVFTRNVTFSNNSAAAGGGAMLITAPDKLDLSGSRFYLNKAEFGGAVSLTSTKEETRFFEDCYFEENEATDGGALYLYTGAGTAAVQNSIFYQNYAREFPQNDVPQHASSHPILWGRFYSLCIITSFCFAV